jgi:transcriptional regulator with XRE-family HTH domain
MEDRSASFGVALSAVRAALKLSQDDFGARLGVSRRTLSRWEIHDELPPVGQRKHIATSFPDAPADLRAALVRSLELDARFVASLLPPAPTPAPALATAPPPAAALDSALLALCERADVPPGRMRTALVEFLRGAEATGLSLPAIRAALEPRAGASPVRPTRART